VSILILTDQLNRRSLGLLVLDVLGVKLPDFGSYWLRVPDGQVVGEDTLADQATTFLKNWEPRMLSVLRIMVGLLFMQHGLQKLIDFPPAANPRPYVLMSLVPGLAGILEGVGGLLITIGLFTRWVAFILSGQMAFAYFMSHAPKGFFPITNGGNGGELAIVYCFVFLYFALAGGGPWSLDNLRAPGSGCSPARR
jgi:putative oxidoreductase